MKADFDEIRHKLVPSKDGGFPLVDVKNFNDREESTIIEIAVLMNLDWVKILIVVPILSILTLMVLPIMLYWHSDARAAWFYKTTDKLDDARRILIVGREKNFDMCDLEDRYAQFKETIDSLREAHGFEKNHLRVFTYRFI